MPKTGTTKNTTTSRRVVVTTIDGDKYSVTKNFLRQLTDDSEKSILPYRLKLADLGKVIDSVVKDGESSDVDYHLLERKYDFKAEKHVGPLMESAPGNARVYLGGSGSLYIGCQTFDKKSARRIIAAARRAKVTK